MTEGHPLDNPVLLSLAGRMLTSRCAAALRRATQPTSARSPGCRASRAPPTGLYAYPARRRPASGGHKQGHLTGCNAAWLAPLPGELVGEPLQQFIHRRRDAVLAAEQDDLPVQEIRLD